MRKMSQAEAAVLWLLPPFLFAPCYGSDGQGESPPKAAFGREKQSLIFCVQNAQKQGE